MEIENLFNNSEILALVEEEIEKVAGGKIDVKMGATRVLATALSALSLAGGVSTHAMEPNKNSLFSFFTKKLEKGKKTNKSVVGKFTHPGDHPRMREFMCNHFNSFEIHSDEFWKENIGTLISDSAYELLIHLSIPEYFKKFQSVFNDIFKGNHRFSRVVLERIADYVGKCIRSRKPVTRANILLVIIEYYNFSIPCRNKVFIPMFVITPPILNNFPKNFLKLPQVEKEFSFPNVKRDIPYDSILAYLSDINYMMKLITHAGFFIVDRGVIPEEVFYSRYNCEINLFKESLEDSDTIEKARYNFYIFLDYIKNLLGPTVLDLFESFNNYDYEGIKRNYLLF